MAESRIEIKYLSGVNTLVINKEKSDRFFVSTETGIVISVPALATLLKFLVMNNFISHKVLEGILEEYHSNRYAGG